MTKVLMSTNKGDIEIELNAEKAPDTVRNFLEYVNSGFYNGTVFHRVIKNFMIQGGGFTSSMEQKDTYSAIQNEADNGLSNEKGSIAMARTMDPHSATAQFFVNLVDNDFLNFSSKTSQGWGYAVFGKVTKGMDVVEMIGDVQTGLSGGMSDVPLESVVIEKATVIE
ncbi:MAG: peptidyl-prolyl cis-trans isomerase [Gammaproteobacteria bacterium]|nr:peptidyl-prolyl cis-trans isomerase [Gammaproteobacteria bacterium]